jgi:hypothetical protein
MPKYKVKAKSVSYYEAEIEAENEFEAWEKAQELDGGEFEELNTIFGDNWEIDDVVLK